jgi:lysophospholipase L1-like esterase
MVSDTLNLPAESSISFTPTVAGIYTLRLTANDSALISEADVSFTVIAAQMPAPAPVKILPLGDSITQGREFSQSYRYPLWKKLVDSDIEFDFVGSLTENFTGTPDFPDYKGLSFDRDHEGHWGFRVDQILSSVLPGSLIDYDVDLALIHLGTNDVIQGQTTFSTINELEQIITLLRDKNSAVKILLAEPIPTTASFTQYNDAINELGSEIRKLVPRLSTLQSKIVLVDQASGINVSQDIQGDGLHPTAAGEEKIAQKWFNSIKETLEN